MADEPGLLDTVNDTVTDDQTDGTLGAENNEEEEQIHWSDSIEGLSDDGKKLFKKYETQEAAFEAHVNLDKLRGNSITLPKEDATPEEKAEQMGKIFNKLGRPETPEGYKLKMPADLPDQLKPTDEGVAEFYKWAHANGLSQTQMQAIADLQAKKLIGGLEEAQAAQAKAAENAKAEKAAKMEKDVAELKTEWGDEFEKKMDLAEKAFDIYGKNPVERARLFYQIYLDRIAEDMLIGGRAAASKGKNFFDYE